MTHAEKLQQIFDAALKDCSEPVKPLARAFPATLGTAAVTVSQPAPEPECMPEPVEEVPTTAAVSAGLIITPAESAELGRLLEEQQERESRKRRRDMWTSLAVVLVLIGGGSGWFVQSPQRVQALNEAVQDVRSLGDVSSLAARYQAALDKVAIRSKQIDTATESMGVSSNQDGVTDPTMDAETLAMMGGSGKTTRKRSELITQKFQTK